MHAREKILITPRAMSREHFSLQTLEDAGYQVLAPFRGRRPSEEELLDVLPDCTGYIAGGEWVSARVLEAAVRLKVISRNGIGVDNIDCKFARKKKIAIRVARGANAQGVAELTLALMFSMVRSLYPINRALKRQEWLRISGMELQGKTLGIIGTGEIGRRVAKMSAGLDMKVLAYDPYPIATENVPFSYVTLSRVLAESDILSLHCPIPAGGEPLINGEALARVKRGCYLINTARAGLVQQDSLLRCLEDGMVAAYAVDAFEQEPPEFSELLRHPRVLLSSHIGGYTTESIDRAAVDSVKNLLEEL